MLPWDTVVEVYNDNGVVVVPYVGDSEYEGSIGWCDKGGTPIEPELQTSEGDVLPGRCSSAKAHGPWNCVQNLFIYAWFEYGYSAGT